MIKEEESGPPIMVRQEALEERGLASRWQDEVGLVYSLPQELIDQLDGRIDELEAGMSGAGTSAPAVRMAGPTAMKTRTRMRAIAIAIRRCGLR